MVEQRFHNPHATGSSPVSALNFMASGKTKISENLETLEGLYAKREKLENQKARQLHPHQVAFNEATKPITDKFDEKVAPIDKKIAELMDEISAEYNKTKQADGSYKLGKVEFGGLVAEPYSIQSAREVDAKSFFDSVPALKRESVWGAFKVLIGKAEKIVGKEALDKIAKVTTTWSVQVRRK